MESTKWTDHKERGFTSNYLLIFETFVSVEEPQIRSWFDVPTSQMSIFIYPIHFIHHILSHFFYWLYSITFIFIHFYPFTHYQSTHFFLLCGFLSRTLTIHRIAWEGEAVTLTPPYHLSLLHRHLDISQETTAESSSLHIDSSRTRIWNLWFPRAIC